MGWVETSKKGHLFKSVRWQSACATRKIGGLHYEDLPGARKQETPPWVIGGNGFITRGTEELGRGSLDYFHAGEVQPIDSWAWWT